MTINYKPLFDKIMNDPDVIPEEGTDKEDLALSLITQRAKQSENNNKALSMAKDDDAVSKFLDFINIQKQDMLPARAALHSAKKQIGPTRSYQEMVSEGLLPDSMNPQNQRRRGKHIPFSDRHTVQLNAKIFTGKAVNHIIDIISMYGQKGYRQRLERGDFDETGNPENIGNMGEILKKYFKENKPTPQESSEANQFKDKIATIAENVKKREEQEGSSVTPKLTMKDGQTPKSFEEVAALSNRQINDILVKEGIRERIEVTDAEKTLVEKEIKETEDTIKGLHQELAGTVSKIKSAMDATNKAQDALDTAKKKAGTYKSGPNKGESKLKGKKLDTLTQALEKAEETEANLKVDREDINRDINSLGIKNTGNKRYLKDVTENGSGFTDNSSGTPIKISLDTSRSHHSDKQNRNYLNNVLAKHLANKNKKFINNKPTVPHLDTQNWNNNDEYIQPDFSKRRYGRAEISDNISRYNNKMRGDALSVGLEVTADGKTRSKKEGYGQLNTLSDSELIKHVQAASPGFDYQRILDNHATNNHSESGILDEDARIRVKQEIARSLGIRDENNNLIDGDTGKNPSDTSSKGDLAQRYNPEVMEPTEPSVGEENLRNNFVADNEKSGQYAKELRDAFTNPVESYTSPENLSVDAKGRIIHPFDQKKIPNYVKNAMPKWLDPSQRDQVWKAFREKIKDWIDDEGFSQGIDPTLEYVGVGQDIDPQYREEGGRLFEDEENIETGTLREEPDTEESDNIAEEMSAVDDIETQDNRNRSLEDLKRDLNAFLENEIGDGESFVDNILGEDNWKAITLSTPTPNDEYGNSYDDPLHTRRFINDEQTQMSAQSQESYDLIMSWQKRVEKYNSEHPDSPVQTPKEILQDFIDDPNGMHEKYKDLDATHRTGKILNAQRHIFKNRKTGYDTDKYNPKAITGELLSNIPHIIDVLDLGMEEGEEGSEKAEEARKQVLYPSDNFFNAYGHKYAVGVKDYVENVIADALGKKVSLGKDWQEYYENNYLGENGIMSKGDPFEDEYEGGEELTEDQRRERLEAMYENLPGHLMSWARDKIKENFPVQLTNGSQRSLKDVESIKGLLDEEDVARYDKALEACEKYTNAQLGLSSNKEDFGTGKDLTSQATFLKGKGSLFALPNFDTAWESSQESGGRAKKIIDAGGGYIKKVNSSVRKGLGEKQNLGMRTPSKAEKSLPQNLPDDILKELTDFADSTSDRKARRDKAFEVLGKWFDKINGTQFKNSELTSEDRENWIKDRLREAKDHMENNKKTPATGKNFSIGGEKDPTDEFISDHMEKLGGSAASSSITGSDGDSDMMKRLLDNGIVRNQATIDKLKTMGLLPDHEEELTEYQKNLGSPLNGNNIRTGDFENFKKDLFHRTHNAEGHAKENALINKITEKHVGLNDQDARNIISKFKENNPDAEMSDEDITNAKQFLPEGHSMHQKPSPAEQPPTGTETTDTSTGEQPELGDMGKKFNGTPAAQKEFMDSLGEDFNTALEQGLLDHPDEGGRWERTAAGKLAIKDRLASLIKGDDGKWSLKKEEDINVFNGSKAAKKAFIDNFGGGEEGEKQFNEALKNGDLDHPDGKAWTVTSANKHLESLKDASENGGETPSGRTYTIGNGDNKVDTSEHENSIPERGKLDEESEKYLKKLHPDEFDKHLEDGQYHDEDNNPLSLDQLKEKFPVPPPKRGNLSKQAKAYIEERYGDKAQSMIDNGDFHNEDGTPHGKKQIVKEHPLETTERKPLNPDVEAYYKEHHPDDFEEKLETGEYHDEKTGEPIHNTVEEAQKDYPTDTGKDTGGRKFTVGGEVPKQGDKPESDDDPVITDDDPVQEQLKYLKENSSLHKYTDKQLDMMAKVEPKDLYSLWKKTIETSDVGTASPEEEIDKRKNLIDQIGQKIHKDKWDNMSEDDKNKFRSELENRSLSDLTKKRDNLVDTEHNNIINSQISASAKAKQHQEDYEIHMANDVQHLLTENPEGMTRAEATEKLRDVWTHAVKHGTKIDKAVYDKLTAQAQDLITNHGADYNQVNKEILAHHKDLADKKHSENPEGKGDKHIHTDKETGETKENGWLGSDQHTEESEAYSAKLDKQDRYDDLVSGQGGQVAREHSFNGNDANRLIHVDDNGNITHSEVTDSNGNHTKIDESELREKAGISPDVRGAVGHHEPDHPHGKGKPHSKDAIGWHDGDDMDSEDLNTRIDKFKQLNDEAQPLETKLKALGGNRDLLKPEEKKKLTSLRGQIKKMTNADSQLLDIFQSRGYALSDTAKEEERIARGLPPGPPPRPGLVWAAGIHHWVTPEKLRELQGSLGAGEGQYIAPHDLQSMLGHDEVDTTAAHADGTTGHQGGVLVTANGIHKVGSHSTTASDDGTIQFGGRHNSLSSGQQRNKTSLADAALGQMAANNGNQQVNSKTGKITHASGKVGADRLSGVMSSPAVATSGTNYGNQVAAAESEGKDVSTALNRFRGVRDILSKIGKLPKELGRMARESEAERQKRGGKTHFGFIATDAETRDNLKFPFSRAARTRTKLREKLKQESLNRKQRMETIQQLQEALQGMTPAEIEEYNRGTEEPTGRVEKE